MEHDEIEMVNILADIASVSTDLCNGELDLWLHCHIAFVFYTEKY